MKRRILLLLVLVGLVVSGSGCIIAPDDGGYHHWRGWDHRGDWHDHHDWR